MSDVVSRFHALPGHDLIEQGLADLAGRRDSIPALLVAIGAPRLRMLGLDVPDGPAHPEHRLYFHLAAEHGNAAHGRYNALVRRLVSFERALAPSHHERGRNVSVSVVDHRSSDDR